MHTAVTRKNVAADIFQHAHRRPLSRCAEPDVSGFCTQEVFHEGIAAVNMLPKTHPSRIRSPTTPSTNEINSRI